MVGDDVGEFGEPEEGKRGEERPLVGNTLLEGKNNDGGKGELHSAQLKNLATSTQPLVPSPYFPLEASPFRSDSHSPSRHQTR